MPESGLVATLNLHVTREAASGESQGESEGMRESQSESEGERGWELKL